MNQRNYNNSRSVDAGIFLSLFLLLVIGLVGCKRPKEDIVLRQIKDVVVDASTDPMLKANAIFYNPNSMRGK
ncbi:MAG TPA: hypothetical protein VFG46_07770, partial [Chryseolinea sp.]|nr:hypothetical protein [Chryseolinea sp.]